MLGHEVGHVTARHSAQRYDQAQLGQVGALAGSARAACCWAAISAAPRVPGSAARACGQAGVAGCPGLMSRATRASRSSRPTSWASAIWAPPATIPAPWRASSRHCRPTTPTGSGPRTAATDEASFLGDWFRSHPRTPERVARAVEATSAEMPGARDRRPRRAARRRGRHALGRGPGAGRDPGHAASRTPACGSRSRRRPASACRTRPRRVAGGDGQGRLMLFDMADGVAGDLRGYLQQGWVTNQRLQDLQAVQLPIGPAAVGFGQVAIGGSPAQAMFAVVGGAGQRGLPLHLRRQSRPRPRRRRRVRREPAQLPPSLGAARPRRSCRCGCASSRCGPATRSRPSPGRCRGCPTRAACSSCSTVWIAAGRCGRATGSR